VAPHADTKGQPITFLGVAGAAGVSNWLVYAKGVREHIETARKGQQGLRRREREAEDTVGALRQSLKQLMRDQGL
jgi:hypothetical protein